MMQRRDAQASRKEAFSAAVSERALTRSIPLAEPAPPAASCRAASPVVRRPLLPRGGSQKPHFMG